MQESSMIDMKFDYINHSFFEAWHKEIQESEANRESFSRFLEENGFSDIEYIEGMFNAT